MGAAILPAAAGRRRRAALCYICGMGLIEAVPNVSEGRRRDVIEALAAAASGAPGATLLDTAPDAAHNRTVLTLAGSAAALKTAVVGLCAVAFERIDLRAHAGVHPRIGALDVVPFVPLDPAGMTECAALAAEVGETLARRFALPVYLYEEAARAPHRRPVEQIRRGGFEGLAAKMRRPEWRPDFGPAAPHPTGGAAAVGARRPLVAFNVNLDTGDLDVARRIARAVRASNGGLDAVKAIGVRTARPDVVQVSMNLVDFERTPPQRAFEAVRREAERRGATIRESEIVGLVPAAALPPGAARALRLRGFSPRQVLDLRIAELEASPPPGATPGPGAPALSPAGSTGDHSPAPAPGAPALGRGRERKR